MHTPPIWDMFVHPLMLHRFFFVSSRMLFANSSLLSKTCAFFYAASFPLCTMPVAHSSLLSLICASFTTTWLLCPRCPVLDAYSTLLSVFTAPISRTYLFILLP